MKEDVDEYIKNASVVTQPIITHLREIIHKAAPEIEEKIKWRAPSFEANGRIICNIMAFKKHVNFMFHQGKELSDPNGILENIGEKSNMMGIKGIERVSDLPEDDLLLALMKQAVDLADV